MKEEKNKQGLMNKIIECNNFFTKDVKAKTCKLEIALDDENIENVCHRLDNYYDDLLKIGKYSSCRKKLSEISDKIEDLDNEEIKQLFIDYQHYLQESNQYEICLANILGLSDGIIFSAIR